MKRSRFETGRLLVKILALLSVCGCIASLMAGEGSRAQLLLTIGTLLVFASVFVAAAVYCRCPHCGKVIFFGVWQKTVCPHCRRNLSSGKKLRGNRR